MKGKKNSKKQAEKFGETEDQYRRIVENIPDVLWTADYTGKTTYIGPTIEILLGYTSEEVYENSSSISLGRIHPEDFEEVKRDFKKLFEDGSAFDCKYRIKKKDEKWIWVHDRSIKTYKSEGVLYADGILTDITAQKQIENDLKSSEERLKIIFEYAPDAIYLTDFKGNFLDGNKAAEGIIGYKKEELIGKNFVDLKLLSMKYLPKALKTLAKNALGKKTGPEEFSLNRKNGSHILVEISNFPVIINDKNVILGIARDISERKHTEEKIKFLSKITQQASSAVLTTDLDFKITWVNDAFTKLYGYELDEIIGRSPDLLNAEPLALEIQKKLYETVAAGKIFKIEAVNIKKDGSVFQCEFDVFPIFDENGDIFAYSGHQTDISERKKAQEEIQKLKDGLEIQVAEQTKEIKDKFDDLQRFVDSTVDRELRMEELYEENVKLKAELKGNKKTL